MLFQIMALSFKRMYCHVTLQLKELEKILNDGQVFTEFQKLERRSEVSGLKRDTLASGFSWETANHKSENVT